MLLIPGIWPGAAFGQFLSSAENSGQPSLRIVQQTNESVTYELTARWGSRLTDTVRQSLSETVYESTGGLSFVSTPLQLRSTAQPHVTVLSAEYDEIPLNLTEEEVFISGLDRPVASVVDVGLERRVPTGTVVAAYLRVDAETQTLRRYRRIVFRVDLPSESASRGGETPVPNPHLDVGTSVLASGTWYKVPVTQERSEISRGR